MSQGEIVLDNVHCRFRHVSGRTVAALDGVSVTVPAGQLVCLVGPSGHGKSTLLRVVAGLTPPTEGVVHAGGEKVTGPAVDRPMVFQEDTVFPWMRVTDNVEFGLRAQGVGDAERRRTVARWLEEVGLTDFADSWPKELSGGMRKRVAVATVFATGAPYLLMDEPFGALDYVTRLSLQNMLLDLWRETRRTILFVTHDVEEALVLADRILVMRSGRLEDDIEVSLPRPRDEDIRARPDAVAITKRIHRHLGLDDAAPVAARMGVTTS